MPESSETEEVRRLKRELDVARRVSQTLFKQIKIDDLVSAALRSALDEVDAETGSIFLADPATKRLVAAYSVGESPAPRGTALPWDQGIAGQVFQSGEPLVYADVKKSGRHFGEVAEGFVTRDMITLPLKGWEGDPIGVMNVLNKRVGRLGVSDLGLLTIISAFAAVAIQRARLFEEARLAEVVHRLGDLGHDLKSLLTPVAIGSEMLKEELAEIFEALGASGGGAIEKRRRTCDAVILSLQDCAQRTQERVRQIADCVKGLSSPPRFAPCRLAGMVAGVLKTVSLLAKAKGIALKTEGLDELPMITADEGRLFNALYNLVDNAIAEVPEGGLITVSGAPDSSGGYVLLSVRDTGRGMPPDVRNSLFKASAISRKPGGTGLGTKIVKDVVDAHGGTISVESEEGRGALFLLRLPILPRAST